MPLFASKLTRMLKSTRSESNHCVYKLDILEGCSTACCTPHPLVCEAKCVCGRQTEGARSSGSLTGRGGWFVCFWPGKDHHAEGEPVEACAVLQLLQTCC